jgi:hypothetical protein
MGRSDFASEGACPGVTKSEQPLESLDKQSALPARLTTTAASSRARHEKFSLAYPLLTRPVGAFANLV